VSYFTLCSLAYSLLSETDPWRWERDVSLLATSPGRCTVTLARSLIGGAHAREWSSADVAYGERGRLRSQTRQPARPEGPLYGSVDNGCDEVTKVRVAHLDCVSLNGSCCGRVTAGGTVAA
jgi:hypothetical protein